MERGILAEKGVCVMNTRKVRSWIAAAALALAVATTAGAATWQMLPWAKAGGNQAEVGGGEFLLVDQGGEVCVYAGDHLISSTGIPVRTLPELDRIALAQGIHATGQKELATLLEDFGA